MTKPTMPEPTAEIRVVGYVTIFDLTRVGKQQGLSVGQKFITTEQAEAYKDACVREALEQVERILTGMYKEALNSRMPEEEEEEGHNNGCLERALALTDATLQIRALLPPTE